MTEMTMVERVALAIETADRFDTRCNKALRGDQWEVFKRIPPDEPIPVEGAKVANLFAEHEDAREEAARLTREARGRAAIDAMREPTDEMSKAGNMATRRTGDGGGIEDVDSYWCAEAWRGMIDEALK